MAAQEVRELHNIARKLVEIEERGKMLESLVKKKISLNEEENFIQKRL